MTAPDPFRKLRVYTKVIPGAELRGAFMQLPSIFILPEVEVLFKRRELGGIHHRLAARAFVARLRLAGAIKYEKGNWHKEPRQ